MRLVDRCLGRVFAPVPTKVRFAVPVLDEYLESVAARCRPNTVLAVAGDGRLLLPLRHRPGSGNDPRPDEIHKGAARSILTSRALGRSLDTRNRVWTGLPLRAIVPICHPRAARCSASIPPHHRASQSAAGRTPHGCKGARCSDLV